MIDHFAYLHYVLRHKWHVFRASRKLGVPLVQSILHDASKFLPSEWKPYVKCFYAPDGSKRYNETPEFNAAWCAHQRRNLHHWQAWLLKEDEGGMFPIPMPMKYIREMVADWVGAGIAITGSNNVCGWYGKNWHKMKLHPVTRAKVEKLLVRYWFDHEMLEPAPSDEPRHSVDKDGAGYCNECEAKTEKPHSWKQCACELHARMMVAETDLTLEKEKTARLTRELRNMTDARNAISGR